MNINYILSWYVLPIFLTSCAGVYLTSLLCRLANRGHRPVRLYFPVLGAFGAGMLAVLFLWLGLAIPHGEVGKFDAAIFFGSFFLQVTGCALVPAIAFTWLFRKRHAVAA